MSPSTPEVRRARRAASKTVKAAASAQPAVLDVVLEPSGRPTEHKGIKVKREELIGNLPKAPFKISRLVLVGGQTAFACRDCLFTGDSRGEVMGHRNEAHGIALGGRRKVADVPPLRSTPDPILPDRGDGKQRPSEPLQWTLGELIAIAPSLTALGDLVEETQEKLDQAQRELHELRIETREWKVKAEAFDELRDEAAGLRNWKRKMITRLKQMGFEPTDDEEQ